MFVNPNKNALTGLDSRSSEPTPQERQVPSSINPIRSTPSKLTKGESKAESVTLQRGPKKAHPLAISRQVSRKSVRPPYSHVVACYTNEEDSTGDSLGGVQLSLQNTRFLSLNGVITPASAALPVGSTTAPGETGYHGDYSKYRSDS